MKRCAALLLLLLLPGVGLGACGEEESTPTPVLTATATPEATPTPAITPPPRTTSTAQTTAAPEDTSTPEATPAPTETLTPEATPAPTETLTPEATPPQFIVPTPRSDDIPRSETTLGSPDAPLTIVEYSDFLCPYCARAALNTLPRIEEEYVAAGKVKVVFKNLVVHGKEAALAAGAAQCASEQGAFWEYHDMLYLNAGSVDFTIENLKQFGEVLGLDTDAFNTCLDSESYMDKLTADIADARERGINATPSFLVGQTLIVGAKPYEEFETAIEDQLADLGEGS